MPALSAAMPCPERPRQGSGSQRKTKNCAVSAKPPAYGLAPKFFSLRKFPTLETKPPCVSAPLPRGLTLERTPDRRRTPSNPARKRTASRAENAERPADKMAGLRKKERKTSAFGLRGFALQMAHRPEAKPVRRLWITTKNLHSMKITIFCSYPQTVAPKRGRSPNDRHPAERNRAKIATRPFGRLRRLCPVSPSRENRRQKEKAPSLQPHPKTDGPSGEPIDTPHEWGTPRQSAANSGQLVAPPLSAATPTRMMLATLRVILV